MYGKRLKEFLGLMENKYGFDVFLVDSEILQHGYSQEQQKPLDPRKINTDQSKDKLIQEMVKCNVCRATLWFRLQEE